MALNLMSLNSCFIIAMTGIFIFWLGIGADLSVACQIGIISVVFGIAISPALGPCQGRSTDSVSCG